MDCSHGGRDAAAAAVQAEECGPPRASDQTGNNLTRSVWSAEGDGNYAAAEVFVAPTGLSFNS